jgi:ATP-dependent helicase/nuclease subunit A
MKPRKTVANLFLVGTEDDRTTLDSRTPDWQDRAAALDVQQSWIVEAPAGSGKTGLLIQRFLKLLADESVSDPAQVMAITFTVKATAELRDRVLSQLAAATNNTETSNEFDRLTRTLAEAVLVRDRALRWDLVAHPDRLRIRTIDSVCAEIARSLPVLSGSGGQLAPVLDASPLHREAARRTFLLLGGEDGALNRALRSILLHRDGSLPECERLVADMLSRRDQWGELIPLTGAALTDEALDATVLPKLERALDQAICAGLQQLAQSIPGDLLEELTDLSAEMGHAAGYKNEPSPIALCAGLRTAPGETAEHIAHWRALIHLLTTKEGGWRAGFRSNWLFFEIEKHHAARLKELAQQLNERDDLLAVMKRVKALPPAEFPPEQWDVAKALFRILQRALIELQFVFAERGECDFNELGLLARTALRRDSGGDDLAAALGLRLQHLLVDEMQDTSSSQYELIQLLTQGWDGQSQTVFLVGDPKQSIYLFRQARVERFLRVMKTELLGDLTVSRLQLTANFRSQRALVEQFNEDFSTIFPHNVSSASPGEVPFAKADATRSATSAAGRVWHTRLVVKDDPRTTRQHIERDDAKEIRRIASAWRARPLPPGRTKPWSIAVLVRSRNHLGEIVTAFKHDDGNGPLPFRAVDIELLSERQEVLDLFALTRALLHPADRVAWLAILRAPWCGLTLADLHLLAGADDPKWAEWTVDELLNERGELLSPDGCRQLERVWTVMQAAAKQRSRLTTAQWVERTWRSLGGDAWLGPGETANANRYLQLLDELQEQSGAVHIEELSQRLDKLYAEAAILPGAIDLMTIHGAKGLEWDVVIVPALERRGQSSRGRLLTWLELDSADDDSAHVILAPIAGRGEPSRELNSWLASMETARELAERKRLYYVACTRAREELHLFGAPEVTAKGVISVRPDSLLKAAWPAAATYFAAAPVPGHVTQMPAIEEDAAGLALAASEEQEEDSPEPPPTLKRLPVTFHAEGRFAVHAPLSSGGTSPVSGMAHFERPEGSFAARAFGNAVHACLELLSQRLAAGFTAEALLAELPGWQPRITSILRSGSLPPAMVNRLAGRCMVALENTLKDETGRWVLAPHPNANSEYALTSWQQTERRNIRLDRIFRSGTEPITSGAECLWVVDFKTTTHSREGIDDFLQKERETYAPQMETYARILAASDPRNTQIRVMLYYPLIPSSTWWVFDRTTGTR